MHFKHWITKTKVIKEENDNDFKKCSLFIGLYKEKW